MRLLTKTGSKRCLSCIALFPLETSCIINIRRRIPILQSSSGQKWKCMWTNTAIYSHSLPSTSLEVKGRWGLLLPHCLLVTVVLQPGTFQSSISVEALLWRCHLDVQSQQLLPYAMVQHCGLLPVNWVVLCCMLHYSWLFHHPPLTDILVFSSAMSPVSGMEDWKFVAACSHFFTFALMKTGAFSWNDSKVTFQALVGNR